jgi:hypothetical protein
MLASVSRIQFYFPSLGPGNRLRPRRASPYILGRNGPDYASTDIVSTKQKATYLRIHLVFVGKKANVALPLTLIAENLSGTATGHFAEAPVGKLPRHTFLASRAPGLCKHMSRKNERENKYCLVNLRRLPI